MAKITQTPLMKQYEEMKRKHPDAVLLFRVGDFYETFSEDAVIASDILGITLTRRANGANNYVELAGFPHHALDTYLPKLVRAGKRVAICEQIESPLIQKSSTKSLGSAKNMRATAALTEVITLAKAEPVNEVPVTKAVDEVKKAVAPICQQLTLDFGPDF